MPTKTITLQCTNCGTQTPMRGFTGACASCGEVLVEARYDLPKDPIAWMQEIKNRRPHLWRYREVLPVIDTSNIVSLGEGGTPLIKSEALGASLGLKHLYIKDERQGPTGSFKDRQATVAITALKELGVNELVVASTGNVAIAYAAYCARVGIKLWAFFPSLTPNDKMREVAIYGAEVIKTTGNYDQTKQLAAQFAHARGIFLDRGIKSVASIEAMKTMAYEIGEQLAREYPGELPMRAPDWFLQGVSGGMGPIGVAKGFREMQALGLTDKVPSFGMIQSTGCAPMVEAFHRGQRVATPVENPQTVIVTLATGAPGRAYELLYDYVQENGGDFVSASDEEAFTAIRTLARSDGISVEPATGVTFAGLFKMVRQGTIKPDDIVVINCSGHTLPVETIILGEQWQKQIDLAGASSSPSLPTGDLAHVIDAVGVRVRRVVVIEDNVDSARLMHRILSTRDDCEIRLAHNGAAGLDLVRAWKPDLVITDLMMPDVDGFEVIREMKSDLSLAGIPIVVVTAKELTVRERSELEKSSAALLQKGGFLDDEFVEKITKWL
jgi:threonine synthase